MNGIPSSLSSPMRESNVPPDCALRGIGGILVPGYRYHHSPEMAMADVNIQQTPPSSGGNNAVWAVVVLVIVLLAGWFFFMRGGDNDRVDVDATVTPPATEAPATKAP